MLHARISRRLSLLALVVAIGAGGADRLDAQARSPDSRSTLVGVVVDPSHAPLPDVAVVVEDLSRRVTHRATTDRQGRFEITDLPAGEFEAEVAVAGFAVFREPVRVAGPLVEREIVLAIDALEETFTVVAGAGTRQSGRAGTAARRGGTVRGAGGPGNPVADRRAGPAASHADAACRRPFPTTCEKPTWKAGCGCRGESAPTERWPT